MANDTKERILHKSLEMFVEYGYKETNLRDLASELGISKSAIYRHFDSKDAIWDALVEQASNYYDERFGSPERLPHVPASLDEFSSMVLNMLDFTIHDTEVVLCRKLISSEQYHEEKARELALKHFNYEVEKIFEMIFSGMIEKGLLKRNDPAILAFAFSAPISELVHYIDRAPEKEKEAMEKVRCFIKLFVDTYGGDTNG